MQSVNTQKAQQLFAQQLRADLKRIAGDKVRVTRQALRSGPFEFFNDLVEAKQWRGSIPIQRVIGEGMDYAMEAWSVYNDNQSERLDKDELFKLSLDQRYYGVTALTQLVFDKILYLASRRVPKNVQAQAYRSLRNNALKRSVFSAFQIREGALPGRAKRITLKDAPKKIQPFLLKAQQQLENSGPLRDVADLDPAMANFLMKVAGVYEVYKSKNDHTVMGYALWARGQEYTPGVPYLEWVVKAFDPEGRCIGTKTDGVRD